MKANEGYIALISVIIISVLLLTITFSLSLSGFFSRFNILDTEFKKRSVALAEACGDTALLKLAASSSISTPLTVPVGSDNCTISSVQFDTPSIGKTTVKTQAKYQNIFTNLAIIVNTANTSVISWEEIPTIP